MNPKKQNYLTRRTWTVMLALALTGQIAWAVENSWFNTFVFDTITPDPRPVAWMVAASAITATLTTLLMGTLSDRTRTRWGKRRPYILIGYILWGLSTILFPTVAIHQDHRDCSHHGCCCGFGDDLFRVYRQ
jgi:MFS family permease